MKTWDSFPNIWIVDYEFYGGGGNPQIPICYVAKNFKTKEVIKHWITETETEPEYSTDEKTLFVAYFASAEMGCHQTLNFKLPLYIVDLFAEFRCLTNGAKIPSGNSLIGACNYYGLSSSDATYKDTMRDRILQGPPYSEEEKTTILDYCHKDVEMTVNLFLKMQSSIDLPYALLRGRYMAAVASMEYFGIPIDTKKLQELIDCWDIIKDELIYRVDTQYNVYEGTVFKINLFKEYLEKHQIPWDYTPSGLPVTANTYMRIQAKTHPELKPLQELRYAMGQLKLNALQVGSDGRNRCLLSPFRSKTSRNQPSSSKFIFGNAIWLRGLIKPQKGQSVAYLDYAQQEIAIAAALSDDENLKTAYKSGDPYLAFAKTAGAIPPNGTKQTHPDEREKYKICMLALNYGMSVKSFSEKAKITLSEASLMIKWHKREYKKYWEWIHNTIDQGILSGLIGTTFHWYYQTAQAKYRSLMNWPMQSHGAEILRLAISMCVNHGIKVIAPVHDAILIEASSNSMEAEVKKAQQFMEQASEFVLNFKISTDAKIIHYPDHYKDARGEIMWQNIWDIIRHINPAEKASRLQEKILKGATLDYWDPIYKESKPKLKQNISKKRKSQLLMKPENLSEKAMVDRIKKKSGFSHIEVMHLIRMARSTDFDLEEEVDWDQGYNWAKETIMKNTR